MERRTRGKGGRVNKIKKTERGREKRREIGKVE